MENQHQHIKGYRDLSQEEIDLMNEIKEHGEKTGQLIAKVAELRDTQVEAVTEGITFDQLEESFRCLDIAKAQLQQGQMWFVRAVELPDSF